MNPIRTLLVSSALAAALAAHSESAQAQVPPCGTVLTQSIRLTSDVYCPRGENGYVIGKDNVTIDLNGFTIHGIRHGIMGLNSGIRAWGVNGFRLVGPGRIEGFWGGMHLAGGDSHFVSNVDMSGNDFGVSLDETTRSTVEYSSATQFSLYSSMSAPSTGNAFVGNRGNRIHLNGCLVYNNRITGNTIGSARWNGRVELYDGSHRNLLEGNKIFGAVYLGGAYDNDIQYNQVTDPMANPGASVPLITLAMGYDSCRGIGWVGSDGNRIFANELSVGTMAVHVDGDPLSKTSSQWNVIQANAISNMKIAGLFFAALTNENDARGNAYAGVPAIVIDQGQGNLWP